MSLYRPVREYRNGRIWLTPGRVVDLDAGTAAMLERDSPGLLAALPSEEAARFMAELGELASRVGSSVRVDLSPARDDSDGLDEDRGSMHSGNMFGGRS